MAFPLQHCSPSLLTLQSPFQFVTLRPVYPKAPEYKYHVPNSFALLHWGILKIVTSVMLNFAENGCHTFYGTVVNNSCSDSQEVYIYTNIYIYKYIT